MGRIRMGRIRCLTLPSAGRRSGQAEGRPGGQRGHRRLQGVRAAAPADRVRPRRTGRPDRRVAALRGGRHLVGALRPSRLRRGLGGRPRGPARADRAGRRPRGGRPGHRGHAGQGRPRARRRPAHQHASDRSLSGGLRSRDAHRDVGAPGHPGERRHPAPPGSRRHRARRRAAHRRRHRQGRLPTPARSTRSAAGCWRAGSPSPTSPAAMC